jgi:hypothetical protein
VTLAEVYRSRWYRHRRPCIEEFKETVGTVERCLACEAVVSKEHRDARLTSASTLCRDLNDRLGRDELLLIRGSRPTDEQELIPTDSLFP